MYDNAKVDRTAISSTILQQKVSGMHKRERGYSAYGCTNYPTRLHISTQ